MIKILIYFQKIKKFCASSIQDLLKFTFSLNNEEKNNLLKKKGILFKLKHVKMGEVVILGSKGKGMFDIYLKLPLARS